MRRRGIGEIEIKGSAVIEFLLWIVGYLPVAMIILVKYFFSNDDSNSNWNNNIIIWKYNLNVQFLVFMIVVLLTVLLFKTTLSIFIHMTRKKVQTEHSPKISGIKRFDKLNLDEYSFFILSLMLPFIFESGESIFDLLIIFSLIFILIIIMIKMEQITVNPIFLFSKLKVLEANVTEEKDEENGKNVTLITDYSIEDLENAKDEKYYQVFNNVYFLLK